MPTAQTVTGTDHQGNFLSCSNGQWGLYEGLPNMMPVADWTSALKNLQPTNPQSYDAILKLCDGTTGLTLPGLSVAQGNEDSLNIANHANKLVLGGDFGIGAPGLRVITIKGGVNVISFLPGSTLHSRGTQTDIKIDDWIDQTYNPSSYLDLTNLRHVDGKPIRVATNYRASNIILGPNCVPHRLYAAEVTAYWYIKYTARALPLPPTWKSIPVGSPGPAFLP